MKKHGFHVILKNGGLPAKAIIISAATYPRILNLVIDFVGTCHSSVSHFGLPWKQCIFKYLKQVYFQENYVLYSGDCLDNYWSVTIDVSGKVAF